MYDEQPDGDPHGECAAEIGRLEAINTTLVKACQLAIVALKGREHDGFLRDAIEKATGSHSDAANRAADAVDTLIEDGWTWDGDQWQRPIVGAA